MFKYFVSREFLFTLLGLVGLGVLTYLALFFLILPMYTRHGAGITVPDVQEMSYAEALELLDDADLRPDEEPVSIYMEGMAPGLVVKQYPGPYSRVKPGRLVSLTINQSRPPMVAVPLIKDMILYQAKVRLEGKKLAVGRVTRVPHIGKDKVLEVKYNGQDISGKSNIKVPMGSRIDVVVGQGLGAYRVKIPDLTGLTYDEGYGLLKDMGLGIGSVVYNSRGPSEELGKIYAQTPRSGVGDSVRIGTTISLSVYGTAPEANEGIIVEQIDQETNPDGN
ncbi:MAG: PASTA domain-containing protein [Bacteroidota bacterium]